MTAIIKRDFLSYFTTPIGYVILAVFWFFSGMYFTTYCISELTSDLSSVIDNCFFIILFIVPLMTMRTFSEDKRRKTDQLLYTAPVGTFQIIMGKFLSSFLMFATATAIFPIYALVMEFFGDPGWLLMISNLLGIWLFGAALIAIGLFVSSLTENQIVAAVLTLAAGILIYLMDTVATMVSVSWVANLLLKLSLIAAYLNFSLGLVNLTDVVFNLSVIALFLFFTGRVIARRRA